MDNLNLTKKQIFAFVGTAVLLFGLAATLYLVQTRQIFKSRAGNEDFTVTSSEAGSSVSCEGYSCTTDTLKVKIKLNLDQMIK